jgi:hypothetical protein
MIATVADGCKDTTLLLTGNNEIPEGLEDFTDGYAAAVTMDFAEAALGGERYKSCWSMEDDTEGHFCYKYKAGELEGSLRTHAVEYKSKMPKDEEDEAEMLQRDDKDGKGDKECPEGEECKKNKKKGGNRMSNNEGAVYEPELCGKREDGEYTEE